MIPSQILYDLLDSEDITFSQEKLPQKIRGIYYDDSDDLRSIILNSDLEWTDSMLRTVLAEEIGHHFTETTNIIPQINAPIGDRISRSRSEARALTWAANCMVPTSNLLDYIKCNKTATKEEISEAFNVDPELLDMKFYIMSLEHQLWVIEKPLYLNLANWPSVFVMQLFE